jgi:hypothetical protein
MAWSQSGIGQRVAFTGVRLHWDASINIFRVRANDSATGEHCKVEAAIPPPP